MKNDRIMCPSRGVELLRLGSIDGVFTHNICPRPSPRLSVTTFECIPNEALAIYLEY